MENNENTQELIEKLRTITSSSKARSILYDRGCNCISKTMLKKATDARKNVKNESEIIDNLIKNIRFINEIEGKLYMIYPKCYCHRLKNNNSDIPKTYCYCSEGWVKHLFETALGKEVKVNIEKSVRWRNEKCQIRIEL